MDSVDATHAARRGRGQRDRATRRTIKIEIENFGCAAMLPFGSRHRSVGCDVLVVEDDQDLREALAEILRDEGFDVKTAENGARAAPARVRRRPAEGDRLRLDDARDGPVGARGATAL